MTKRWMIGLKGGAFRVPVFSACLPMTCMLGNNPVVLVDKQGVIKSFNSGYRPSRGLVFDDWEWGKEQPAGGK